jgi:ribosomal protein S18 acetylase RimI-like enzyme
MTVTLRAATLADVEEILPRTLALNAHEGIVVGLPELRAALARLLGDRSLGGVWIVEDDGVAIGHAVVTFGYDLEFAGRDAWLTEFWIDDTARGRGAGTTALALLDAELRTHGVAAYHLQVRSDNPALRLYERHGFSRVPRLLLTRRL